MFKGALVAWWGAIPICLLLGWLISITPVNASGAGAGYVYPRSTSTAPAVCSPTCIGVRVSFIQPAPVYTGANSEAADSTIIYVGLFGENTHGSQCTLGGTNNPLLQFGTQSEKTSGGGTFHITWREEAPCNNLTTFGSLVINSGDTIFLQLLCTLNCVTPGDSTAVYSETWTNVTTGLSQSTTRTGFNVFGDFAQISVEQSWGGANSGVIQPSIFTTPIKFFNAQINQGSGWIDWPGLDAIPPTDRQKQTQSVRTVSPYNVTPLTARYGESALYGGGANGHVSFNACAEQLQTSVSTPSPCSASDYNATNGLDSP